MRTISSQCGLQCVGREAPVSLVVLFVLVHAGQLVGTGLVAQQAEVGEARQVCGLQLVQQALQVTNVVLVQSKSVQTRQGRQLQVIPQLIVVQDQLLQVWEAFQAHKRTRMWEESQVNKLSNCCKQKTYFLNHLALYVTETLKQVVTSVCICIQLSETLSHNIVAFWCNYLRQLKLRSSLLTSTPWVWDRWLGILSQS